MPTGMLVPAAVVGPMIASGRLSETAGRSLLSDAVRLQVGGRLGPPQLDVARVAADHGAEVAGDVVDYLREAERLWVSDGDGGRAHERSLIDARQVTSSQGRHDLDDEHAALGQLPAVGAWLDELLADSPDLDVLERRGRGLRAQLDGNPSAAQVTATIVPTTRLWPAALGGHPSPAERHRRVRITVRRARWRTRRLRRLARVAVVAVERWP